MQTYAEKSKPERPLENKFIAACKLFEMANKEKRSITMGELAKGLKGWMDKDEVKECVYALEDSKIVEHTIWGKWVEKRGGRAQHVFYDCYCISTLVSPWAFRLHEETGKEMLEAGPEKYAKPAGKLHRMLRGIKANLA